jgi:hypothetical protein
MEPNPYESPRWPQESAARPLAPDDSGPALFAAFWFALAVLMAIVSILGSYT